jgi:hypothetical protein
MGYNLKDTKKTEFEPIPEGRYSLRVESVEVIPHEKDNVSGEKIALTMVVTDGTYKNRKVWDNVFVPWALWKARQILEAGGSRLADSDNITAQGMATAMKGIEVSAFLEPKTGNNNNILINVSQYKSLVGEDAPLPSFMK